MFRLVHETIAQVFPGAVVTPGLVLGATDARHYQPLADAVFRFVPIRVGKGDLNRTHGVDERIAIANYIEIVQFYAQLMRNLSEPP